MKIACYKHRKHKKGLYLSDGLFSLFMLMPAILVLGIVVALPIGKGIIVSFCKYTIKNINNPVWNNFANYIKIFKDGEVVSYLKNTIIYTAVNVFIQFSVGLFIALLLNSKVKGVNVFRGFFLIPWTIPSVVVAIVWRWMLQPQIGVINYLLYTFGITDTINLAWNMSSILAMPSVILASAWRQLPYMMVMILAGLQSIDSTLIEASKIDGANAWKSLIHITLPSIRPVLATSIWISIMSSFQMFTIIYNMTGGGPIGKTTTLSVAVHHRAFISYNFGESAAISVIWLLILFIVSIIYNRINQNYTDSISG